MKSGEYIHKHVWNLASPSFRSRKVIALIILCLLLGGWLGYMTGTAVTIRMVASIAAGFIDKTLLEDAIYRYQNNLKNCYPSIFE